MFDIKMNDKYKQCIAKFLKIDVTDLNKKDGDHWGLDMYNGWAVGTDEEATKAVEEYIKNSLWAVAAAINNNGRGHFLASYDSLEKKGYYIDEQGNEQTLYFYKVMSSRMFKLLESPEFKARAREGWARIAAKMKKLERDEEINNYFISKYL